MQESKTDLTTAHTFPTAVNRTVTGMGSEMLAIIALSFPTPVRWTQTTTLLVNNVTQTTYDYYIKYYVPMQSDLLQAIYILIESSDLPSHQSTSVSF